MAFTFLGEYSLVSGSCRLVTPKDELQVTNSADIQVITSGASIIPFSIHLFGLISGTLSWPKMSQNGLANYLKPVKSVHFKNYKLVIKYQRFLSQY